MRNTKTTEQRLKEIVEIYRELSIVGVKRSNTPELTEFFDDANDFVKNGTSSSRTLNLSAYDRRFEYQLSKYEGSKSYAVFRYVGNKKTE